MSLEFLNVDDDEVDEDHEDDDIQYGDETRLLENSGWSSRTRSVQLLTFPHSINFPSKRRDGLELCENSVSLYL